jgi:hypothetical protein
MKRALSLMLLTNEPFRYFKAGSPFEYELIRGNGLCQSRHFATDT